MPISSMTGFARAEGGDGDYTWAWEMKSVNGRGLDVRVRLPSGLDRLEPAVRAAVQRRFQRGSVALTLELSRLQAAPELRINRELVDRIIALHRELGKDVDPAPPRLEGLLAVRGVIETAEAEESEDERARRDAAVSATLDQTIDAMAAMRLAEGARLAPVLHARLDEIEVLSGQAEASAALLPEAQKARLKEQLAALVEAEPALPEERLVQELALLAAKADVREELDRLKTHVAAARELVDGDEAVGRRLDFLCQELNREANTVCSKAADMELTRIGLALKAAVEQLREQVQNIE